MHGTAYETAFRGGGASILNTALLLLGPDELDEAVLPAIAVNDALIGHVAQSEEVDARAP